MEGAGPPGSPWGLTSLSSRCMQQAASQAAGVGMATAPSQPAHGQRLRSASVGADTLSPEKLLEGIDEGKEIKNKEWSCSVLK